MKKYLVGWGGEAYLIYKKGNRKILRLNKHATKNGVKKKNVKQ